jgi:hypothetical protein
MVVRKTYCSEKLDVFEEFGIQRSHEHQPVLTPHMFINAKYHNVAIEDGTPDGWLPRTAPDP